VHVFKLPSAGGAANPGYVPRTATPKTAKECGCAPEFRFLALCGDSQ
jgi:hypothetical protein